MIWCCRQAGAADAWIEDLLDKCHRYLHWDLEHRNGGNGLPVWEIEGNTNCRSGESGLDNSPRFDAATAMEAVDFSAFLAMEFELLANLAKDYGRNDIAADAHAQHQRLNALMNERLWSEERGCYCDFDIDSQELSPVIAVTTFLPLICGAANEEQLQSLEQMARDPNIFGTSMPLPSIARNDPTYRLDMWCDPVWINLAWLVVHGFDRYGRHELAADLREGLCRGIERQYEQHGTLFEFFDPDQQVAPPDLQRKGRCAPDVSPYHQVFHDFGWTASLFIDMRLADQSVLPVMST